MVQCVDKKSRELCHSKKRCSNKRCELAPDLSVVIPVLNEIKHIENLLDSLRTQKTDYSFEIVLSDNGSIDGTMEYLKRQKDVKLVREKKKGISFARNTAIRVADAPFLAQTDADSQVPENWIQEIGDALIQDKYDMVGGLIEWDIKDPKIRSLMKHRGTNSLETIYKKWKNDKSVPMWFTGANMAFSRKIYNAYGGYREDLNWGEDTDFSVKTIGKNKIKFLPNITIKTSPRRYGETIPDILEGLSLANIRKNLYKLGLSGKVPYERRD